MDALQVIQFAFVDSSPLYYFFESLAHVFELKVGACLRTRVFVVWVVVEVDAFVVHQIVSVIFIYFAKIKVSYSSYLFSCFRAFSESPFKLIVG